MHSKIIEISKTPMVRDEYMSEGCFCPEEYDHFADYIQIVPQDSENDIISWLDKHGIFERNGRELTLLDLNPFIEEWRAEIKKRANNIDFTDGLSLYRLKEVIKETHQESSLIFYFGEFMPMGELVHWLYNHYQPGDKFYIGGILDYHY